MPEELLARVRTHLKLKQSQAALKKANEKLLYLNQDLEKAARTDALTNLPNRRDMLMRLEQECLHILEKKPTFSLAIADIDNFKHFNDTHGHDCGDFVLISLAQLLQKNLRKNDHIARWGGEEFLFLLPETTAKEAGLVLDRLRQTVANEIFHYQDLKLHVNITLGVCQKDQRALHECLKIADDGLYAGKHRGKNRVMLPTKQGFESIGT
jgi:diguanylate cyclase (GGDEF)-like protein